MFEPQAFKERIMKYNQISLEADGSASSSAGGGTNFSLANFSIAFLQTSSKSAAPYILEPP